MSRSHFFAASSLLLLVLFNSHLVLATEVFKGKVISVSKDMLSLEAPAGKRMTFFVAKEATILRNGQPAKLEEIKADELATVTTDNKGMAVIVSVRTEKSQHPITLRP